MSAVTVPVGGGSSTIGAARKRFLLGPLQAGDRLRELRIRAATLAQDGNTYGHITMAVKLSSMQEIDSDAAFDALTKTLMASNDYYPTHHQQGVSDSNEFFAYDIPILAPPLGDERYVVIDVKAGATSTFTFLLRVKRDGY